MVHVFEKTPVTYNNKYEIDSVSDKNAFRECPCVIVILAETWFLSSVNGAMKLVSNLVDANPNKRIFGLGFGEISFGGLIDEDITFSEFNPTDDEVIKFVDDYFVPLVFDNNSKIELTNAMKNIRNINFVTYCNGAKIYKKIEEALERRMKEIGYSNEEVELILSQICLAAVGAKTIEKGTKATSLLFVDKCDYTINDCDQSFKENDLLLKNGEFFKFSVSGDGNHDFKKYMDYDLNLSFAIKLFLNKCLDNSIINFDSIDFIPINFELLINDMVSCFNERQQSEVKYETYLYKENQESRDFIFSLYHKYKNGNYKIDINELIKKLGLSSYSIEKKDKSDKLIEIAHQGGEVLAFCTHGNDYLNKYEIFLIVCSKPYRKNGIATKLLNRAFYNMNSLGIDSCVLETAKSQDNYSFWINKGAMLVRTRWAGIFENIEVSILQFSNIKQYLDSIDDSNESKLIRKA